MNKLFLLADDDFDDAEIFEDAIGRLNAPVNLIHFDTGVKVIDYLQKPAALTPDFIFLDLNMPEMNGWQCLTKIKQDLTKKMPVIIYSTSSSHMEKQKAKELGADGFVTKPSDIKEIVKMLKELIQTSGEEIKQKFFNS